MEIPIIDINVKKVPLMKNIAYNDLISVNVISCFKAGPAYITGCSFNNAIINL